MVLCGEMHKPETVFVKFCVVTCNFSKIAKQPQWIFFISLAIYNWVVYA
jgi:hypothetical protein